MSINKKYFSLFARVLLTFSVLSVSICWPSIAIAEYRFSSFEAKPPVHVYKSLSKKPQGLDPATIKKVYNLPVSGGQGTIAIITAYDHPYIESDLAEFDKAFGLDTCTIKNKCLSIHKISGIATKNISIMSTSTISDSSTGPKSSSARSGWDMETALDVEWAHAIAPQAKILLVEAPTPSGASLLKAIDYARTKPDVVAVSMSWGGKEFPEEISLDSHFVSSNPKLAFFSASGDLGAGVSWPAVSPHVVAVGGTSLASPIPKDIGLIKETAWKGSGGGISIYESIPDYQKSYGLSKNKNMRSVPDVSYNADPHSGYSIYVKGNWYVVGGTSAGAPQWSAIHSLGLSATAERMYVDKNKDTNGAYFRDIVSGKNGSCGTLCTAKKHYDYVTGLGSPLTVSF